MNHSTQKCAVIGAGIAGIAASIRLAAQGWQVSVYESNSYPGGKLTEIKQQGYRFDAGPSLFTMPHLVDELFKLAGKNPTDYFTYKKLDTLCHYFYEDGTHLRAYADLHKFAQEIENNTKEKSHTIFKFLEKSHEKYLLTADVFLHNSLHKWKNYLTKSTLKGILNFYKLDTLTTMHQTNQKIFKDPKVIQFFNRYATYNGSDPYQTPGTMNIIPHLEFGIGAFFPKGGMHSITQSLVKLAQEIGVQFHFNTSIQQIITKNKKVTGVQTKNGEIFPADIVVSNMDVTGTYQKLLPTMKPPHRLLNQPKSSSAVIFYWGIQKEFSGLGLHNIFFSQDYASEFNHLFQKKNITDDPTIYINISAKENPSDAPEGCENWFTMVNAPNNTGQNWDQIIQKLKENIIQKLNRMLHTDIRPLIACESILDPRSIEKKTSSSLGALYGNSSNSRFAAFLRHANFSAKLKNLYFCGGSVHPGGGIPLSLLSAKIACDCVKKPRK